MECKEDYSRKWMWSNDINLKMILTFRSHLTKLKGLFHRKFKFFNEIVLKKYFAIKCYGTVLYTSMKWLCIKRKQFTTKSISFSDMKKWPVILWPFSRSVDLWCVCKPHPQRKTATQEVSRLWHILNMLLFLEVNFTEIKASVTLFANCFYITILWKRYVFFWNGSLHIIPFK